jgi:disulfide bond formation protein DsbB
MIARLTSSPLFAWAFEARNAALLMLAAVLFTLGGAWFIQLVLGIQPCPLCLEQRIPYYASLPLLANLILQLRQEKVFVARTSALWGLILLAIAIAGAMGAYHAGVEWGFWKGPSDCTGDFKPAGLDQLMSQLNTVKIIRCDAVAMRIFGLSLAAWNAIIATTLVIFGSLALTQWRQSQQAQTVEGTQGSNSLSQ